LSAEPTKPTDDAIETPPHVAGKARAGWLQFNLRVALLLMAAAGVWTGAITNWRAIAPLQQRIDRVRPIVRELAIHDPSQGAVVKFDEEWYDENEWEVYLPAGKYRLVLATEQVDEDGFAPVEFEAPLAAGRHRLEVAQTKTKDGWEVVVFKDGQALLRAGKPKQWCEGHGSSGGGHFAQSEPFDPAKPLVLFRRRFSRRVPLSGSSWTGKTPMGPTEGVQLWIEPAVETTAGK
jgi:hypothetical protein